MLHHGMYTIRTEFWAVLICFWGGEGSYLISRSLVTKISSFPAVCQNSRGKIRISENQNHLVLGNIADRRYYYSNSYRRISYSSLVSEFKVLLLRYIT